MSRLAFLDRLQTIVVTATVTSAVWIVVGTVYGGGGDDAGKTARGTVDEISRVTRPAASATVAESGAPAAEGRLTIPVAGVAAGELVDSFADDRGGRRHEAIDIIAPAGTAVVAAGPGTVEKLFLSDAGGNTVYVRSDDRRTIHYYAHLQAYAAGLAEGQPVRRGQRLGSVGWSGNADPNAPHLHFAVRRLSPEAQWWEPAVAIDPFPLFTTG